MISPSNIKLTIGFNDLSLDPEERDRESLRLMSELKDIDEVEEVNRVPDGEIPAMSKAFGGFLVGLLTAEVNPKNIKSVFRFLSDRLGGKSIELEVEANGRRLKVSAGNREELAAAVQAAQDFISVGHSG
jgi:hypothetical protein